MKNNEALNVKEAADLFSAHIETVRRMARKGEIPAYKIGKDWRFSHDALITWAKTHHIRQKQLSILAIDDDPIVSELIKDILESEGYRVLLASDGDEGMLLLENKEIDLILLDLKMPKINGPEFLRRSREMDNKIPVIVVTGYPESDLMAEAMKYGPITLVAKPVRKGTLINAVNNVFNGIRKTL
jgi:excisionase family DNA binding protein